MRALVAVAAALALSGCTPPAPAGRSTPQDQAYCTQLSDLYLRYVGPDPNAVSIAGVTPDASGGVAVAQCLHGNAAASIPTLERLLRRATSLCRGAPEAGGGHPHGGG